MEAAEDTPNPIPLYQHVPLVTTVGCPVIDEWLQGGLRSGCITELTGKKNTQKTLDWRCLGIHGYVGCLLGVLGSGFG